MKSSTIAGALLLLVSAPLALAAAAPPESGTLLPSGNSKDPVSIEADKLVYSDKDGKAVYSGNVIVIQGDTKMVCTVMTLYLDRAAAPSGAPTPTPTPTANASGPPANNSQLRHMDCKGPVSLFSKTQTGTGDAAEYDKPENKFWLIGNVTLSNGGNVTKGDKLTYDLTTGRATVEMSAKSKTRVQGLFISGSSTNGK